MKKLSFALFFSFLFINLSLSAQYAYDDEVYDDNLYPGYLGDDFSLEGALEVFKESRDIQNFERDLNNEGRYVNNLDLNNDGRIDFIRVTDQSNDRNHRLITLQAILGRGDVQDVAVIAIEKTGRRSANLQIIGDEYLFGPDMIVEPSDIAYNQNRYDRGPNADVQISRFFVNVWYWPSVRSIFYSRYSYYRSPYSWGNYPTVWNPWRPYRYATYYDRCGIYRNNYWRTSPTIRIVYFNNYYRPNRRVFSPRVQTRYQRNRPYYRGNRGNGNDRVGAVGGGRGTYNGPRRTSSQTKPARRTKFDSRREKNVVYNRDNQVTTPKRSGRKSESVRPSNEVRKNRSRSASKYDRPATEVKKDRNSYSKRPTESRNATPKKSNRGSSYSKKPSRSNSNKGSSSYSSKPSRSSSASKSNARSNKSSRSSASKAATPKRSSAPKASRKSTTKSSSKSSRSSGRSSSKSSKSTKSRKGF